MPVPMTIIFMKYGLRYAVLLGVTVGVLMGIFIDPITALYQFIIFGSVGLAWEPDFGINGRLHVFWERWRLSWQGPLL